MCVSFTRVSVAGTRSSVVIYFFFQAEDGIRDLYVTGVQTCALPIWPGSGDVDGPAGVRAQELQVLHLDRALAPDRPGDSGHRVRVAAAVERGAGVVDVHAVQR